MRSSGRCVVIESMPRVLQRVTAPEVSSFYERIHRDEGVSIVTDAALVEIATDAVVLADGREIAADILIAGIGVVPDTVLAEHSGLASDNGVLVDERCRTRR